MRKRKGQGVRPVIVPSVADKVFKPVIEREVRLKLPVHPAVVAIDLRQGSLASLDRYLRAEPVTLDPEVALELRKMLSGGPNETSFRLVVIEHPEGPKAKGGKPRLNTNARRERDQKIVTRYAYMIAQGDKRYHAIENLSEEFSISKRSVRRVLSVRESIHTAGKRADELKRLSLEALRKLRAQRCQAPGGADT